MTEPQPDTGTPAAWQQASHAAFKEWRLHHSRGTEQETWDQGFLNGARWAWRTSHELRRLLEDDA